MHFKLNTFSTNMGTFGKLTLQGKEVCCTVERPWMDNLPFKSCIPAGIYDIHPVNSPKFGETYQVIDVEGRTHILIHKANKPSELHGCIAPVSSFGLLDGEWCGFGSGDAYYPLMNLLDGKRHTLEIERW